MELLNPIGTKQVAKKTKLSMRTIQRYVKQKKIPDQYYIKNRDYIFDEDVVKYIKSNLILKAKTK